MYPGTWAQEFPDKPAVINSLTRETRTYGELNDRSNQLAQFWWQQGLRCGDHVAVFCDNHVAFFDVVWAALRSGLYLTTINRYLTAEEAAYILNDCEARSIVASAAVADVASELPPQAPNCQTWLSIGAIDGYQLLDDAIGPCPATTLAEEPAGSFMLYSSGTTGRPKGIERPLPGVSINEDSGAVGGLQQALWGFGTDTVYLSPAPLYHSAPASFCASTLSLGGTVIMMPRFDPVGALQAIQDFHVTHSQWVPTMFSRMLKLPEADRAGWDLSSHKVAIHAAAPCPRPVKEQMLDWWGKIIYEYYAGTEVNGFTHVTPEAWLAKPGTVGQPILGTIHICDDDGNELPTGKEGIVYFELPTLPFSYHNDPDKTRDAQHPDHDNWSALGDVGYVDDDGYLFLTDRATFMIISGGVNIYPQEIEDAMIMHPKVADVAVIGVPHEEMGEAVKAVVQPAEGIEASPELEEELLEYAHGHIARYKCPKSVDFQEELPRLPTGKLYKRLLKDRYWGKHDSRIV